MTALKSTMTIRFFLLSLCFVSSGVLYAQVLTPSKTNPKDTIVETKDEYAGDNIDLAYGEKAMKEVKFLRQQVAELTIGKRRLVDSLAVALANERKAKAAVRKADSLAVDKSADIIAGLKNRLEKQNKYERRGRRRILVSVGPQYGYNFTSGQPIARGFNLGVHFGYRIW